MKVLFISILLLQIFNPAQPQGKSNPREMFLEAESYFLYEEYKEALPLYIKLSLTYPHNDNINYRLGRCYLNIPYEKDKAIAYLETASKNINPKYKAESLKETSAPLDVLFYLGDAYRINNQLEKAIATYKKFKEISDSAIYDHAMVNDQLMACENAAILEKKPVKITYANLGETINTRFSESNAVVSGDESTLVYNAQLQFYTAVFYTSKVNGKWNEPIIINQDLLVDEDCYPVGISYDGTELYLYRNNEFLGDLYVSCFKDDKWTKIKKLNDNINTRYWESHACITSDGKKLYFTSNRKDSYGGLDIYVSTRIDKDTWGEAVNLGPVVNSPLNEETPFISANGQKLYFSSLGHNGMGGYDVFVSELSKDGQWTEPRNLGYPLNTTDNDLFFQPLKDGNIGYMSLFNKNTFGRNDIYRLEIEEAPVSTANLHPSKQAANVPSSNTNEDIENESPVSKINVSMLIVVGGSSRLAVITDQKAPATQDSASIAKADSLNASIIASGDDSTMSPGQKQAWHKILYGGLGILAAFVFFILFLYLRALKRKDR